MLRKIFYKIWNFWLRLPEKLRFLVIGGFNTVIAYMIFVLCLLVAGTDKYQMCLLLAWILSSFVSFVMMKTFVFCTKGGWKSEYLKCAASWLVSYVVNAVILQILVQNLMWNIYLAQMLAVAICTCVTYILFKYFAFKK